MITQKKMLLAAAVYLPLNVQCLCMYIHYMIILIQNILYAIYIYIDINLYISYSYTSSVVSWCNCFEAQLTCDGVAVCRSTTSTMVPRLRYISSIKNQLLLQFSMINWVDFYIELCNIINFLFKNRSHPIIISSYKFGDMFMYFPP